MRPPRFGEGQEQRRCGMRDARCIPGAALHHRPVGEPIPHPDPAGKRDPRIQHAPPHMASLWLSSLGCQGDAPVPLPLFLPKIWASPWHPRLLSHRLATCGGTCCIQGPSCCLCPWLWLWHTSEGKMGWTLPLWTSVVTGYDVAIEKQMGHDCMEELGWWWLLSFPFAR